MKFGDMATNTALPAFELFANAANTGVSYPDNGSGALNLTTFQMPWTGMVIAEAHLCWTWSGYQYVGNWFVAGTLAPSLAFQANSTVNGANTYVTHTTVGVWNSVPAGSFTVTMWSAIGGGGVAAGLDSWSLNIKAARI